MRSSRLACAWFLSAALVGGCAREPARAHHRAEELLVRAEAAILTFRDGSSTADDQASEAQPESDSFLGDRERTVERLQGLIAAARDASPDLAVDASELDDRANALAHDVAEATNASPLDWPRVRAQAAVDAAAFRMTLARVMGPARAASSPDAAAPEPVAQATPTAAPTGVTNLQPAEPTVSQPVYSPAPAPAPADPPASQPPPAPSVVVVAPLTPFGPYVPIYEIPGGTVDDAGSQL